MQYNAFRKMLDIWLSTQYKLFFVLYPFSFALKETFLIEPFSSKYQLKNSLIILLSASFITNFVLFFIRPSLSVDTLSVSYPKGILPPPPQSHFKTIVHSVFYSFAIVSCAKTALMFIIALPIGVLVSKLSFKNTVPIPILLNSPDSVLKSFSDLVTLSSR